jgi:uncharacterized protein
MITQIGPRESLEVLGRHRTGRLGCCLDNNPYVVPVSYYLERDVLLIHSLPGQKIEMLRANPRVCLQVDEIENDYNWLSVLAFGRYEEVTDAIEREEKLATLYRHLPHLSPVESRMKFEQEKMILFRIHIERLTGVCERWT